VHVQQKLDDKYEKNKLLEPERNTQHIQYSCYFITTEMYYTGE